MQIIVNFVNSGTKEELHVISAIKKRKEKILPFLIEKTICEQSDTII